MITGDKFLNLRKRAEDILKNTSKSEVISGETDLLRLLHELDTYRIELELQNEDLLNSNTELNALQDKLKEEISVHFRHYDIAPVGYITIDKSQRIIEINQTLAKKLKLGKQDFIGRLFNEFIYIEDQDVFYFCSNKIALKKTQQSCELRLSSINVSPLWVKLDCSPEIDDGGLRFHIAVSDISQRLQDAEHIHFMAYYDMLTGLPNRELLQDRLKHALSQSKRNHQHGAVFILDLDHFKVVNDSLGHLVGDELLKVVANRLLACIREEDTISRMGGDEFVVLLTDLGNDKKIAITHATRVASKIIEHISEPIPINNNDLQVTVSIGIAMFPGDTNNNVELVQLADNAMYKVKKFGRNNFQFVTASLQKEADNRLNVQHGLHEALKDSHFRLFYQPQVDFETNTISGVEALLRWQNPIDGIINPDNFIKISEDTGLIIPIGTWVLEEAGRTIAEWNKLPSPPSPYLSVNMSVRQFQQKDFIKEIKRVMLTNGIQFHQLELELTESVLIHDLEGSKRKLFELRDMGVRLAIDDFGTGYSSLKYLKDLPIDVLKIDQYFIDQITTSVNDIAIVQTIITLAKNLNLWVVAEGVVSKTQYEYLKKMNCDSYQGYYFSKPVPGDELVSLINNKGMNQFSV